MRAAKTLEAMKEISALAGAMRLTGPTGDDARAYATRLAEDPAVCSAVYNEATHAIDLVVGHDYQNAEDYTGNAFCVRCGEQQ